MNNNNLDIIIKQYVDNYDVINGPENQGGNDEIYKWRVIDHFKKYWNINADDFAAMFDRATEGLGKTNLINNKFVQPLQGISDLMNRFAESKFVREQFKLLYVEDGGDLDNRGERVNAFIDNMNRKIEERYPGSWRFKQNAFCVIFYLSLWKPEDNYIYKATQAYKWANCIDYADDFGSGSSFSLRKYYKMMDELREALPKYPELMDLYNKQMKKGKYCFDDELHIQAFDIIFCSDYMGFYNECPSLGLSTKQRMKIAKENEERENAEDELSQLNDAIDELNSSLKEVPDFTGVSISHKKYGKGKVTSVDGNRFSVCFVDRECRFTLDSILKGFVSVPDEYKELLEYNDTKMKEIQKIGRRIDEIRFKYDL